MQTTLSHTLSVSLTRTHTRTHTHTYTHTHAHTQQVGTLALQAHGVGSVTDKSYRSLIRGPCTCTHTLFLCISLSLPLAHAFTISPLLSTISPSLSRILTHSLTRLCSRVAHVHVLSLCHPPPTLSLALTLSFSLFLSRARSFSVFVRLFVPHSRLVICRSIA